MWLPATKTEVGSRRITVAGGEPDLLRLLHCGLVTENTCLWAVPIRDFRSLRMIGTQLLRASGEQ
jgi:hypothetical protein